MRIVCARCKTIMEWDGSMPGLKCKKCGRRGPFIRSQHAILKNLIDGDPNALIEQFSEGLE